MDGAVALITGSARRIGADIARALHTAGADIALHCRHSRAQAQELARELDAARADSAAVFTADLTDAQQLAPLVEDVADRFGRLDALVHNAAVFRPGGLAAADAPVREEAQALHVHAPWLLTQCALPHLRARAGCVVYLLDIYARRPRPGYAAYSVSKAAACAALRAQALELAPEVRVNGVAPGAILWPAAPGGEDRRAIIDSTALKRSGQPGDIAAAVLFLIRDARYCTGEILTVDGGRSLSPGF